MRITKRAALALALVLLLTLFAPASGAEADTLTRGEFLVALYGESGTTVAVPETADFDDVPLGGDLAPAVRWAAEAGIVKGYGNGCFGPDDPVTREQAAAMLYRYALALDLALAGDWLFPLGAPDAEEVSPYAEKAVEWAVMNRILPTVGEIGPKQAAAREELPTLLASWRSFREERGIVILFTSDVHCGIDQGFGYAGLLEMKNALLAQGYAVVLADGGDSIQGEPVGTFTKGAALIGLMDRLGYAVATPGNHEYDYGMDRFLSLAEQASFPYVSCNFVHEGEQVFAPYVMVEAGGRKLAFLGVTTPETLTASVPAHFQNEAGEFIYGFLQDKTGDGVCGAIQAAADAARAEGAEEVILLAHLGNKAQGAPFTYGDVLARTKGIDMCFDGHGHDTDQAEVRNAEGRLVPRCATGTKLGAVGWCRITAAGQITSGLYAWDREKAAPEALSLDNDLTRAVAEATDTLEEMLGETVAVTAAELTIYDPAAVDANGKPIRIVRRGETNLGDLCADAYRQQSGAEVAFMNGGGVRVSIGAGDVTRKNIFQVFPFGNAMCMVEATGQQILDALEWGARSVPGECGGFLQVSGLTYEIHTYIDSPCVADETGAFLRAEGERRVKNVLVGGEPIDPERTYTLASHNYMLLDQGDGFTMFAGSPLLLNRVKLDNQLLADYITDTLGGVIGQEYADPCGQGRIVIVEEPVTD